MVGGLTNEHINDSLKSINDSLSILSTIKEKYRSFTNSAEFKRVHDIKSVQYRDSLYVSSGFKINQETGQNDIKYDTPKKHVLQNYF